MGAALAQNAGSLSVSVGATQIAPDVKSGNLSAPSFIGTGAIAGVGAIGTTKTLPITAIGQYRFLDANARFRPYVGAGLTFAKFYKTTGTAALIAITNPGGPATTLSFKSKFAPTIQLGGIYNINEKWYLDASYTKTFLKTRGTLSTGQTLDAKLNPDGYTFQVGYKF